MAFQDIRGGALAAAVLALLSVTANAQYYGKGKAPPPPPVVTKG
jgi:hypothetical protein